jgi:hypothetical protein
VDLSIIPGGWQCLIIYLVYGIFIMGMEVFVTLRIIDRMNHGIAPTDVKVLPTFSLA